MGRKLSTEEIRAATEVPAGKHQLTQEDILLAEMSTAVYTRQSQIQEQNRDLRSTRLAQEWEQACQQRTHQAIVRWKKAEENSFYLK